MPDFFVCGEEVRPTGDLPYVTDADIEPVLELLQSKDLSVNLSAQAIVNLIHQVKVQVLADWKRLSGIVERHEATLRKRWTKKTVTKRQELLISEWPHMPSMHRPEFSGWNPGLNSDIQPHAKSPGGLWPYINIEDLEGPKSLLIFINSRGRHHPETFSLTEIDHAIFTRVPMSVDKDGRFPDHKVQLTNKLESRGGGYGSVSRYPKGTPDHDLFELELEGCGLGLAGGLQVLQVQRVIYEFLVKCCEHLLQDMHMDHLCTSVHPVQPEPPSLLEQEENCSSFAEAAKRAPYISRKSPNLSRLRYLVTAALEDAKDHLLALREDPSYFADTVQDWLDHESASFLNSKGGASGNANASAIVALSGILYNTYLSVVHWDMIGEQFGRLDVLRRSPSREPDEDTKALLVTHEMVRDVTEAIAGNMAVLVPKQPSFRRRFGECAVRWDDGELGPNVAALLELAATPVPNTVGTLLSNLGRKPFHAEGIHLTLDYFETYCHREPTARGWISPLIERSLTPLSIAVECTVQLRNEIPSYLSRHGSTRATSDALDPYAKSTVAWAWLFMGSFRNVVSAKFGDPSDGKFTYPPENARDKATVEARRKVERNLDRFWKDVNKAIRREIGVAQLIHFRRTINEYDPYDEQLLGSNMLTPKV